MQTRSNEPKPRQEVLSTDQRLHCRSPACYAPYGAFVMQGDFGLLHASVPTGVPKYYRRHIFVWVKEYGVLYLLDNMEFYLSRQI